MRSESLIRLTPPDEAPRQYDNEHERPAVAEQVEAFLARGGKIQQIPSHIGTCPVYAFGRAPAYRLAGHTGVQEKSEE